MYQPPPPGEIPPPKCTKNPRTTPQNAFWGVFWYIFSRGGGGWYILRQNGGLFCTKWGVFWYSPFYLLARGKGWADWVDPNFPLVGHTIPAQPPTTCSKPPAMLHALFQEGFWPPRMILLMRKCLLNITEQRKWR